MQTPYSLTVLFFLLGLLAAAAMATQCDGDKLTIRTIDGSCNNLEHPEWGKTDTMFRVDSDDEIYYLDGKSTRPTWPNERRLSNTFFAENAIKNPDGQGDAKLPMAYDFLERRYGSTPDPQRRNAFFVVFFQMIAHDITRNIQSFDGSELMKNFEVPILDSNDPLYQTCPARVRLLTLKSSGVTDEKDRFRGINGVTSFLDASSVYGSDNFTASSIREFANGRLLVNDRNEMLLHAETGTKSECGAPRFDNPASACGDMRADENPLLTVAHTLFVREHNRRAAEILKKEPHLSDEAVYQKARKWVTALLQHIVYDEMLPELFGRSEETLIQMLGTYSGYNPNVNPAVSNIFEFSAGRILHDMVSFPQLVIDKNCTFYRAPGTYPGYPWQERPTCVRGYLSRVGTEAFLRGGLTQFAQALDGAVVDSMRNVLSKIDTPFGNLDIEALNIFRSRQHGIPHYQMLRKIVRGEDLYTLPGCSKALRTYTNPNVTENNRLANPDASPMVYDDEQCFLYINSKPLLAEKLRSVYGTVDAVDGFVGLMLESERLPGGLPLTAAKAFARTFADLRDGDRWWYENTDNGLFTQNEIAKIKKTSMADVIKRNEPGLHSFPFTTKNAFVVHNSIQLPQADSDRPINFSGAVCNTR